MNSVIKKVGLIYILFLFTTFSGNPIQATNSSQTATDLEFKQIEQRFKQEIAVQENSVKEEVLEKVSSLSSTFAGEDTSLEEKQVGVTPVQIEIPAIDEKAEIIEVGQTPDGNMAAPADIHTIGWYEPGVKPGQKGNAVLAGHVDGYNSPGSFYNLKKLEPGDEIHVIGEDGKVLTFIVLDKQSYTPEDAPLNEIFGASSKPKLNLITCTGTFDTDSGHYEERLVVYTELVES
ncbi:class F sortase [Planococcus halotolerans]|uniref:Peptidase C60 sortase A and B n=1 Tax=Planococcus halotolerans TaxID=2233542 RepID=A0A365KL35_9BACL|nr:class F sortase [Planococcus halotolerans]RAZ73453.1 peptidase C60 sortase A and B [Planococcus halotolerans]